MTITPQNGVTYRCKQKGCTNHTMRLSRICIDCVRANRRKEQLADPVRRHQQDMIRHCTESMSEANAHCVRMFMWGNPNLNDKINEYWYDIDRRCRKYGIRFTDWLLMYCRSKGRCAICERDVPFMKLHIDHDHHGGHVRGLLCSLCNTGLGQLGIDGPGSAKRVSRVIGYLEGRNRGSAEKRTISQVTR